MAIRNKWTPEEDKILVQAIKANPYNKTKVFKEVSKKVNHSVMSCSTRWYTILSNPESKHYVGCLFTTIGIRSHYDNRGTKLDSSITASIKNKKGLWAKIKTLLNL